VTTPRAPTTPRPGKSGRIVAAPVVEHTEGNFKRDLLAAINTTPGLRAWRQQSGMTRVKRGMLHLAPKGAADVIGIAAPDGLSFQVETKSRSGWEQQPEQKAWQADTEAAGGVYLLAKPQKAEPLQVAVRRVVSELLAAIAARLAERGEEAKGAA
jgi:hypothetical protein